MLANLINRPVVLKWETDTEEITEAGSTVAEVISINTVGEVQPNGSNENATHPDIADSDWIGFFLSADFAYLNSGSEIWVPGLGTYEVDGDPMPWRNPRTQIESHVEVGLRRVAGPQDDRSEP